LKGLPNLLLIKRGHFSGIDEILSLHHMMGYAAEGIQNPILVLELNPIFAQSNFVNPILDPKSPKVPPVDRTEL